MNANLTIEQRRGRQLRKYQILDAEVKAELKTENAYQSFTIRFDDIEFNEIVVDRKPNPVEIGFFFSVMLNLIVLSILISDWATRMQIGTIAISVTSMGIISGMSVWAYSLFKFEREKILKGTQNIFFFYAKKDQEEVDNFIHVLKTKQRDYFRRTYMRYDEISDLWTYENRVKWLAEKKYIDKEEFKNLQAEIESRRLLGN